MSPPEQKPRPEPVRITARMVSSSRESASAFRISWTIASEYALSFVGRFSVTVAPPASFSYRISAKLIRSPAAKFRCAFFEESRDALAMVVGLAAAEVRFGLAIEHAAEVDRGGEVDVGFHVAIADQRARGEARGEFLRLRGERSRGDDQVH